MAIEVQTNGKGIVEAAVTSGKMGDLRRDLRRLAPEQALLEEAMGRGPDARAMQAGYRMERLRAETSRVKVPTIPANSQVTRNDLAIAV